MARTRFARLLVSMLSAGVPIVVCSVLPSQPANGQSRDLIDLDKRIRDLRDAGKYADCVVVWRIMSVAVAACPSLCCDTDAAGCGAPWRAVSATS